MKKLYGKDMDSQTGEVTEHLWRQYDYVWKDNLLDSAKIIVYDEQTGEVSRTLTVKYLYDTEKSPIGFIFTDPNDSTNSLNAWYVKNLQGDVTEIYIDGKGVAIHYTYDAFGNAEILDGDIQGTEGIGYLFAMILCNPTMYRGYYFDIETQMYYLQSRYYVPEWGRFLNADDLIKNQLIAEQNGLGLNRFAYCTNNPVMLIDPKGLDSSPNELFKIFLSYMFAAMIYGDYYDYITIGTCGSYKRKGSIMIDLTNRNFTEYLYQLMLDDSENFSYFLAQLCLMKFVYEYPAKQKKAEGSKTQVAERLFLFSEDCVTNEIEMHILGYLWSLDKKI